MFQNKILYVANLIRHHEALRGLKVEDVDFYFYFDRETDGERCKALLEKEGFEVLNFDFFDLRQKGKWSLIVTKKIRDEDLLRLCKKFEFYAKQFNGEYDGYEREL